MSGNLLLRVGSMRRRMMLLDEDLPRRTRRLLSRVSRRQRNLGITGIPWRSGGFHIWPLGQEEGEQDHESAEESAPVEPLAAET